MGNPDNLTSGRLLARNTLINLVSEVVPFLVAIFAIPALIGGIGVDRYGVLTLSMMVVGYFGLFDFGLGRAATKFIAEAAAKGELEQVPGLFWTSLYLMLAFGAIAAVLVAVLAPWLVRTVLKIQPALHPESVRAFYLLALSMPIAVSGGSLYGTLSAFQRFDLINAVRVPTGVCSYLGPLLVLPFSHSVAAMVGAMVLVRAAGWLAALLVCMRVVPSVRDEVRARLDIIRPMLSFGGYITVSRIVLPVIGCFDRFLIGALLSMAAVAYYTVPFQITARFGIVPGALSGVVFAAFSATSTGDPARTAILFERANRYIILTLFPAVLVIVALAPEVLGFWLGRPFAAESATAMRWLAVAAFIDCLSWTPGVLIQAADRPDITAIIHLAEAPVYLLLLWSTLTRWGVAGAAFTLALRSAVDTTLFLMIASRVTPLTARGLLRLAQLAIGAVIVIGVAAFPMQLKAKGIFLTVVLSLYGVGAWRVLLQPAERELVRGCARAVGMAIVLQSNRCERVGH